MLKFTTLRHLLFYLTVPLALVLSRQYYAQPNNYISSMNDKLSLLQLRKQFVDYLRNYAFKLQQAIKELNNSAQHIQRVLKRNTTLYVNFDTLRSALHPAGLVQIDAIKTMRPQLPNRQDFEEAQTAIFRIEYVYDLNSTSLADGWIEDEHYNITLSPTDCYEMGSFYLETRMFSLANKWAQTAMHLNNSAWDDPIGVTSANISVLMAWSLIKLGKRKLAKDVLEKEPEFTGKVHQMLTHLKSNLPNNKVHKDAMNLEDAYFKHCRSSFQNPTTRLTCFYHGNATAFLRIAPFKVEQISGYPNPLAYIYHDVLYESEMLRLEQISEYSLDRTEVDDVSEKTISPFRTASGRWLSRYDSDYVDPFLFLRLQQRVVDMTGLRLDSEINESMQLLRYGFGGHYDLHSDANNEENAENMKGFEKTYFDDRIATVLFYVNDVEKGGVTAFPYLNIAVKPRRGKALIWNSLDPFSFDYDHRTFHAACPVLVGHKLALTQWIHERDQMFTLPCYYAPKERKYNYSLSYLDSDP
ncbi:prolyl 4-hydroxylase subunit alpha-1 isoform X2 [Drosophila busckii]|uniref:prolyl 4-hydroxylase subunit alpha-1 isoform X1 n=1 Tax=Drosophila busckii TaxID=30019 RepID=UPI00083F06D8|nr:prolyl 4-hydroxylase subunit alpha-1 isoform X1 [Drosophila busckii]XP_033149962.1 prolyl 4-hydroxylase subunit alpha-1 isoform X2 [Drosophila busckii]